MGILRRRMAIWPVIVSLGFFPLPLTKIIDASSSLSAHADDQADDQAEDHEGFDAIAATVNNAIISYQDMDHKIVFMLKVLGLEDTLENRDRIRPQAIQNLIDETLQQQESRRNRVTVRDQQVNEALSRIAAANGISVDDFEGYLKSRDIPVKMFREQLHNQLLWQNLVDSQLRPRIQISEEEIDTVIDFYKQNQGKHEYRILEIYLPFRDLESHERVLTQGQEIVALIRATEKTERRVRFSDLARQLSQSASAVLGGDIGWVTHGQIDRDLRDAVTRTKVGDVSPPVKARNGIHILLIHQKRIIGDNPSATVALKKIALPVSIDHPEIDALQEAVRKHLATASCSASPASTLETVVISDLGQVKIADFPEHIRNAVLPLNEGEISRPIAESDSNTILLQLCSKPISATSLPGRDQILQRLELQRLQKMSEKQMQDLRRRAYIHLRSVPPNG